jgi:UDP-GlcNAc:undecaprenyl-phosphate GlcNAc-1-phosphate transferase
MPAAPAARLWAWSAEAGLPAPSLVAALVAAGVAVLGMLLYTPLVIRLARARGWLAHPKSDRWHREPVALMGGIAMYAACVTATVALGAWTGFAWPVWTGVSLLFAVGLADDLLDVQPAVKLLAQILGTVLLLYAGLAFWPGGPTWASVPLTFLWVIGVTNALNLIDGMDGLAAGLTAVAAAFLGVIALEIGQPHTALAAGTLAGAAGGFLVFNFRPARIFMGDGGSMFLGYTLAALSLSVQAGGGSFAAALVPVVVLAVPIFDTTFVTVTRILSGRPVTQGGNDHTMHRLVLLGLSERHTVLLLYGVGAVFGMLALAVYWSSAQLFFALALLALVACVVFGLYLGSAQLYRVPSEAQARAARMASSQRAGALMQALTGSPYWKPVAGMVADLLLVGAAFVAAYHLRFEGLPPASEEAFMMRVLPVVVSLKLVVFYASGLYHGIWRHAGTPEVVRLVGACTLASLLTAAVVGVFFATPLSLSVLVLDWMTTTLAVGAMRFGFRGLRQYIASHRRDGQRVLIYGTGHASQLALRHLRQSVELGRTPVGFLTPDARQRGLALQGLTVLGTPDDLERLRASHQVTELIIPMSEATPDEQADLCRVCHAAGLACHHFRLSLHPADSPSASFSGDGGGSPSSHPRALPTP